MPISRYRCRKCHKEFQVYQKITDSPLKKCSYCEGKVDLIPTPLFYNTPSFSLAFVEKEEENKPNKINVLSIKKKGRTPHKKAASKKTRKAKKRAALKKNKKSRIRKKKMKK